MSMLIKIGNSQGIRIPKPIIKQAKLEGTEIEFEVTEKGLLLKPIHKRPREDWKENIHEILQAKREGKDEAILEELLNDDDLEIWEW